MKLNKYSFALLMGMVAFSACNDKLELINPNEPTVSSFGGTSADLEEAVIAAYHHIRMEGTYARVGYTYEMTRGDDVWNSSQGWNYLSVDDYNGSIGNGELNWVWRDWYYTVKACNYVLKYTGTDEKADISTTMKRIMGQALFLRGLAYYNLAGYYQNPMIITDYDKYDGSLEGLQISNEPSEGYEYKYDEVLDLVESDFSKAMVLLPSNGEGGQWAQGRATCGAAAGYYARALMQRHKYDDALKVLRAIIRGDYGHYELMPNYGDNFREGPAFENNKESLFEVQFLDYGSQGSDDEWTPVNISKNASQGHAIESNVAPAEYSGWADLSASPWLYELFKSEKTVSGTLDPRLYWTIGTYEDDWNGFEYGNVGYTAKLDPENTIYTNSNFGGLPIAKYSNMRTGLYKSVTVGLKCGINLRLMRYSDVLLRAAECLNEVSGNDVNSRAEAIVWINDVRKRANLPALDVKDFPTADALFEQIANVERPKEFGCEFGRGLDLIRWGWFYDNDRLQQLKEHSTVRRSIDPAMIKQPVKYEDISTDTELKSTFDTYKPGHEFLPIFQGTLDSNPNLVGNSANLDIDNSAYYKSKNWTIHPVVNL